MKKRKGNAKKKMIERLSSKRVKSNKLSVRLNLRVKNLSVKFKLWKLKNSGPKSELKSPPKLKRSYAEKRKLQGRSQRRTKLTLSN